MPTHDEAGRFWLGYHRLTAEQQLRFRAAVARFYADLVSGHIRPGLRVKGVKGKPGEFEMTWAPDGRATFRYGASSWRRCRQYHAGCISHLLRGKRPLILPIVRLLSAEQGIAAAIVVQSPD